MAKQLRTFDCADCGETTTRKCYSKADAVCVECGIRRAADAARAMSSKSGGKWDIFMASNGPRGRPRGTTRE